MTGKYTPMKIMLYNIPDGNPWLPLSMLKTL